MYNFICPVCRNKLELVNRSLVCNNNHCFDLAKEGYVNLLPINSKKSKDPGDNATMMLARRAFLEAGYYEPLAEKLAEIVKNLSGSQKAVALDSGCGEGYYTGYIKDRNKMIDMLGVDISKVAIRYASKKYRDVSFCVASSFELPIDDGFVDILMRIYAPSSPSELKRVIKKGGFLIIVTPGERHLYQLREMIYREVLSHSEESGIVPDFILKDKIKLKYTLKIKDTETIQNLLYMTPFRWKISDADKTRLFGMGHWEIDCDFNIGIYCRETTSTIVK